MTQDAVAELIRNVQADVKKAADDVEKTNKARLDAFEELKGEVAKGSKTQVDVEQKLMKIATEAAEQVKRLQGLEEAVNNLMKHQQRPGNYEDKKKAEQRERAINYLEARHNSKFDKQQGLIEHPFTYTEDEVKGAELAIQALRALMHTTDKANLSAEHQKALSAFTFGSQGFILAPEMSNEILSCLVDITDITGLMRNMTISGPSIKFMVDNEVWDVAAWACESSCFANNPTQQIGSGLGELEIKPESLRYIVCATRELLEDSGVNLEQWMLAKAARAFGTQISSAVLSGDGFGKPMGILNPAAGIPICETAENTAPGQFTWQDLVALRWQVPVSLQGNGGSYLMNSHTWALCATLSDTSGRPIMTANASEAAPFLLGGVPVVIAQ